MSKDVAIVGAFGEVVAINIQSDDYEPQPDEVVVTGAAWVGGDYVDGYFYPPQPFASWTRHQGEWQPPTPMPSDGGPWQWNEATLSWVIKWLSSL